MQIQEEHLHYLIEYCLDVKKPKSNLSKASVEALSKTLQFICDELDTCFHLDKLGKLIKYGDVSSDTRLQGKLHKLILLVDKIALQKNGDYLFDIHEARKAAGTMKYKTLPEKIMALHDEYNYGIREKYIAQDLNIETEVKEVDIKRFLYESGIFNRIHVVTSDPDLLAGMFVDLAQLHKTEIEPYKINFLMKSEQDDPSLWLSVVLQIDPFKRRIDIKVGNNRPVSQMRQDELLTTLKNTILVGYESDELWHINNIEWADSQPCKPHESALFALNSLLQDPDILGNSAQATQYANSYFNYEDLYKHFVSAQLQTLTITPTIYQSLPDEMKSNFINYQLKIETVKSLI